MSSNKPSLCICFVCQAGALELKSLLLASSLRYFNPAWSDQEVELVAVIPSEREWGALSENTRKVLDSLNVRQVEITSPFGSGYPIGNKVAAIGVETEADTTLFLDTDIICLKPFDWQVFETNGLKVKPADFDTSNFSLEQWTLLYGLWGLPVPSDAQDKVVATVSRQSMLPYFNAGAIAVNNGQDFSKVWLDTAKTIDLDSRIVNKRPWLDQLALPVAAFRVQLNIELLTEEYNFPLHARCLDELNRPALCHYHWPSVVEQEDVLCDVIKRMVTQHPLIMSALKAEPDWQGIITRMQKTLKVPATGSSELSASPVRDFLITGIPRSGTSLLCRILDALPETVVVNEPEEVFGVLANDTCGLQFRLFYRRLRTDIILGKGIINKLDENGNVTEDTAVHDRRARVDPAINNTDFRLGTKNPLAYLSRLPMLCRELPNMIKIVTIRHPVTAIASWRKNFSHLRHVELTQMPFTSANDPVISEKQKLALEIIRTEEDRTVKQALLWNYLATIILECQDQVTVLRYEDMQAEPVKELERTLSALGIADSVLPEELHIRNSTASELLTEQECMTIEAVCRPLMDEWAYGSFG